MLDEARSIIGADNTGKEMSRHGWVKVEIPPPPPCYSWAGGGGGDEEPSASSSQRWSTSAPLSSKGNCTTSGVTSSGQANLARCQTRVDNSPRIARVKSSRRPVTCIVAARSPDAARPPARLAGLQSATAARLTPASSSQTFGRSQSGGGRVATKLAHQHLHSCPHTKI